MSTVPLGGVLGALNHLLAALVGEYSHTHGRASVSIGSIVLDERSLRVAGEIRHDGKTGPYVIRAEVQAPVGSRQSLNVSVERWPEHMPDLLVWLKPLLEASRISLDLDFADPATPARERA